MIDFLIYLAFVFSVIFTVSYISTSFMVRFFMNK